MDMILDEKVKIKIGRRNINYIKNFGYSVKFGDEMEFPIKNLPKGSHIRCKCENCGKDRIMWYKEYIKCTLDGKEKYVCQQCNYTKIKKTNLLKYGVENIMMIEKTINKMKNTNLLIYGCECSVNNPIIQEKLDKNLIEYKKKTTRINKNKQIPDCDLTEFQKYVKQVNHFTYKNKKKLFENWNGFDYYNNEYILENFELNSNNPNYPTIDHKISIFYGFKHNISSDLIGDIHNLCITKRGINSSKNKKNHYEFKVE